MATEPKSIRAGADVWAALAAKAQREGVTANALAVRFIEAGLAGGAVVRAEAPQVEKAAPRAKPQGQAQARGPAPKAGEATPYGARGADGLTEQQRAVRSLKTVEPAPPAYGSRLKGAGRKGRTF